jgi:hypothetical protein
VTLTVVWLESAAGELAEAWFAAKDRAVVTAAARDIDQLLRARPESTGESREGVRRIVIAGPLAVTFEILIEDRLVRVLDVWLIDKT